MNVPPNFVFLRDILRWLLTTLFRHLQTRPSLANTVVQIYKGLEVFPCNIATIQLNCQTELCPHVAEENRCSVLHPGIVYFGNSTHIDQKQQVNCCFGFFLLKHL
jgi:hypothetical protein